MLECVPGSSADLGPEAPASWVPGGAMASLPEIAATSALAVPKAGAAGEVVVPAGASGAARSVLCPCGVAVGRWLGGSSEMSFSVSLAACAVGSSWLLPVVVVAAAGVCSAADLPMPKGKAVLNQLLLPIPPALAGSSAFASEVGVGAVAVSLVIGGSETSGLPLLAVVSATAPLAMGVVPVVGASAVVLLIVVVSG